MNLKTMIAAAAVLALPMTAGAGVLTPEEALARVSGGNNAMAPLLTASPVQPTLALTTESNSLPTSYAFNMPAGGWMIVAADDEAAPLLGYANVGMIDADNLPCCLEMWLEGYARQIDFARANGISYAPQSRADDFAVIDPMCKTTWDQTAPYNNYTPVYNGYYHCPTGCQATSLAQVMKYFNYPPVGEGQASYTSQYGSYTYDIEFDFTKNTFNWSQMLDSYSGSYTEAQADAVATLMAATGAATNMLYSPSSSGTYSGYVPYGAYKYLKYNKGAQGVKRDYYYPADDWDAFVYQNLKEYGPVLYAGVTAKGSGHAFVCDGYAGSGYFHFNWGWNGKSDGNFLLTALNPSAIGTGGASGGYNTDQEIIAYLNPTKGPNDVLAPMLVGYESNLVISPLKSALSSNFIITGNIGNYSPYNPEFYFGLMFEDLDGNLVKTVQFGTTPLTVATWNILEIQALGTLEGVPQGRYVVKPAIRLDGTDVWQWIRWNNQYQGLYWGNVEDGQITLLPTPAEIEVHNFAFGENSSTEANPKHIDFSYSVKTNADYEGTVYAVLTVAGVPKILGTAEQPINLKAGESTSIKQEINMDDITVGRHYTIKITLDKSGTQIIGGPYEFVAGDSGLESIATESSEVPAVYYNLQGVRVDNPESGIFLRVNGEKVEKVVL